MNQSYTVKNAFDQADADYPQCASESCMRFAGDEDFKAVPIIGRTKLIVTLNQPTDNYITSNTTITFNCSATSFLTCPSLILLIRF